MLFAPPINTVPGVSSSTVTANVVELAHPGAETVVPVIV